MRKKLIIVIIMFVCLFSISGCSFKREDKPAKLNDVETENFNYTFLQLEARKNNMIYSPLSIKYALSMLREGAKGDTKKEIDELLKDINLTKYEDYNKNLSFANGLFIRDTYRENIVNDYEKTLKEKYDAEVILDKFKNADNINNLIEKKTLGIIKKLLRDNQVKGSNVILINALAIDMKWLDEFKCEDTYGDYFYKDKDNKSRIAFMSKTTRNKANKFYKSDDLEMVSMPLKKYGDTQLEFVAIMPNDLEKYIKEDTIDNDLSKLQEINDNEKLYISIPKFKFDYNLQLKSDLEKLGVKNVFTPNADLTNISNTGELYVSDAIHKADIEFSEEGIKAAAVTVFLMTDGAMMEEEKIISLKFDKPFLFLIRDTSNSEVWFVGTVYEPTLWKDVKDQYQ